MVPFDVRFPKLAAVECRTICPFNNPQRPEGTFILREFYCTEPDCDCRRVLLQVHWTERREVSATINCAFEPNKPRFDDEPRVFLDPINPQSNTTRLPSWARSSLIPLAMLW